MVIVKFVVCREHLMIKGLLVAGEP